MARWIFILMPVVILGLVAAACGPTPTPEVIEKVVKETVVVEKEVEVEVTKIVEVEKEVVVTATPVPVVVTFMSWAEDDFEVGALEELIKRFKKAHPEVTVECEIVTIVPAKGKDICTVVTAEGDLIR